MYYNLLSSLPCLHFGHILQGVREKKCARIKCIINFTNELLAFGCCLFQSIWMLQSKDIAFFPIDIKMPIVPPFCCMCYKAYHVVGRLYDLDESKCVIFGILTSFGNIGISPDCNIQIDCDKCYSGIHDPNLYLLH